MAKLMYSSITSLDGYVQDEDDKFDWAAPDEEVLAFINDLERPIGTYLYGRRMYETMVGWETMAFLLDRQPLMLDFARIWRAADKIVFSRTLEEAPSARTRIERAFDPDTSAASLTATSSPPGWPSASHRRSVARRGSGRSCWPSRAERIEPPAAGRIDRIVRSPLRVGERRPAHGCGSIRPTAEWVVGTSPREFAVPASRPPSPRRRRPPPHAD